MAKTILASGIADKKHLAAFDQLAAERFAALGAEMVYLVDLVNVAALPALAAQFDVLGYKGWALTNTEPERRALLKQAIELHRYKGTPWAVKEAIKRVGFGEVKIVEGGAMLHDGTILLRNGEYRRGAGANWATFPISLNWARNQRPRRPRCFPLSQW